MSSGARRTTASRIGSRVAGWRALLVQEDERILGTGRHLLGMVTKYGLR